MKAVALICDLCGREIRKFAQDGTVILNTELRNLYGTALEVQIQLRAGEENLDGGAGETTSFDLCPVCFEKRLQPWLEEQGATAKVETW